MDEGEWIALGGFVTICASALALVIKQIESSKCTDVSLGCCRCKRKVEREKAEEQP
jgi:hypothetical protein